MFIYYTNLYIHLYSPQVVAQYNKRNRT